MSTEHEYEVLDYTGRSIATNDLKDLHQELKELGAICLKPLPPYQVFVDDITDAFQDKIIVIAKSNEKIVAFASTIFIPIAALSDPVIHAGLTVIHPDHRRAFGVNHFLHFYLWKHLLGIYPRGFWTTTLAEVISTLVHMSKYGINIYPSPERREPSELQLLIATEISSKHRSKMLISPDAEFDERRFIFKGSNNHEAARGFMKDRDDTKYWHRDKEVSAYFRSFLRSNEGDEVLQVGYMDPSYLTARIRESKFKIELGYKQKSLKL
ncbi:hypothetical protein NQ176_g2839 [Zarea fungicola]|uniref:Uncharacterized protein n=1 Tax=Zarea fungicola TaxID=93591 RepID=A0ACC1NLB1_9HYPO|nr:hypothetical protein NQ176_g2839 [Lecanicillium fungicola]